MSDAVTVYATVAPAELVASTDLSAGRLSTGGVVSAGAASGPRTTLVVLYTMLRAQSTSVPAEKVKVPPSTGSGIVVDGPVVGGRYFWGSAMNTVTVGL